MLTIVLDSADIVRDGDVAPTIDQDGDDAANRFPVHIQKAGVAPKDVLATVWLYRPH